MAVLWVPRWGIIKVLARRPSGGLQLPISLSLYCLWPNWWGSESIPEDMQLSIWTWAKIHILRSAVTATIATGAFQSFLLDLTVATPGFLKRYVKESIRLGGGGACIQSCLLRYFQTPETRLCLALSVGKVLKNINPILQSPNIYWAHALDKAQCYL